MKKNKSIILKSSELILQELEVSDVNKNYVSWLNDSNVNQYLESRFIPQDENSVKLFVDKIRHSNNDFLFGIYLLADMKHIGNIRLGPVSIIHNSSSVGIIIGDKNSLHKGYASSAISMITKYAFNELKLSKLSAGCYEENIGSKKAFEKSGYKLEGFLRDQVVTNSGRNGVWRLGCLKSDLF
jgi:[ribosomal protein S5]-alanine N-acetyltransferase